MNSIVERVNPLGFQFLHFAWPMLWQSSLLIGLVFAADLLLARKLRASVRHALWLVVLVKLLLPPSLALPTGAAWWLFPAKPVAQAPAPKSYLVTYDNAAPLPPAEPLPNVRFVPPPPKLDRAGWTFLAAGAVSIALLCWLLLRWAQVVRMVRGARSGAEFAGPLAEAQRLAGLRGPVRVKLVDHRSSPAVCGLFRPVILLPRLLADHLSPDQLRAVLLHEAMHLRRLDIWVNCAQALLQVIYWWHPLVWVANARIRRLREEAVDDAVMLALADNADLYAPTLLEVAKLALRRPLLSLGLVGIMESRSALRQRVERLVAFRPPRQAGLTLVSLLGILAFSAVALPMGQGPAPAATDAPLAPAPAAAMATPPPTVQPSDNHALGFDWNLGRSAMAQGGNPGSPPPPTSSTSPADTRSPSVLVEAAIYRIPPERLKTLVSDLPFNPGRADSDGWWSASPEQHARLLSGLKKSGLTLLQRPRIQTDSGKAAQFFVGDDSHGVELNCLPVVVDGLVKLTVQGELDDRSAGGGSTNSFKANALMENHAGMVIRWGNDISNTVVFLNVEILTNLSSTGTNPVMTLPFRLLDPKPEAEVKKLLRDAGVKTPPTIVIYNDNGMLVVRGTLDQIALVDQVLLQLNGSSAAQARHRSRDFAASLRRDSAASSMTNDETIFSRTFRVNPSAFRFWMEKAAAQNASGVTGMSTPAPALTPNQMARIFLTTWGVDLTNPPGKSVFFNEKLGYLFVRAPESDLRLVEQAISGLSQPASPQSDQLPPAEGSYNRSLGERRALAQLEDQPRSGNPVSTPPAAAAPATQSDRESAQNFLERQKIIAKLNEIQLPSVSFNGNDDETGSSLESVVRELNEVARANDPEKIGVHFSFATNPALDPSKDINSVMVRIPSLTDVRLAEVLDAIVLVADKPIQYAIQNNGVVFSAKILTNGPALFLRTFRVDPKLFLAGSEKASPKNAGGSADAANQASDSTMNSLARAYLTNLGVNLTDPPGKSVSFNDELGYLAVKATKSDMDTIENALSLASAVPPPQIHVKARFIEVPKGTLDGFESSLGSTNLSPTQTTGNLTSKDFRHLWKSLASRHDAEVLGEPEVTLLSGRQCQMCSTKTMSVITNVLFRQSGNTDNPVALETNQVEVGPILDFVPTVLADGFTISLVAAPSLTEFLGYEPPLDKWLASLSPGSAQNINGSRLPAILPVFQIQQLSATVNVRDDQTLVFAGLREHPKPPLSGFSPGKTNAETKEVLVFITPTLIDPAGNRIHTDHELLLTPSQAPPQPNQGP